jgi:hypothetical protein
LEIGGHEHLLFEEITVLLILHSLPSAAYAMLVISLIILTLPSYNELEAKLIHVEMTIALADKKSSEALFIGTRG